MTNVLGLGVATLDEFMVIDGPLIAGAKHRVVGGYRQGGGNCANTLVGLSRLGIGCELISCTGTDNIGKEIIKSLTNEDVSVGNIARICDKSPYSFVIVSSDNKRTIIHQPGPDYDTAIPIPDSALDKVSCVYLDGRFHNAALNLAERAYDKGIPIVVEAERKGLHSEELFQYAKVVVTSENYHKEVYGCKPCAETLDDILRQGARIAIATMGENGSIARVGSDTIKVPAANLGEGKILDTTGAGDAYIAGIIFGLLQGWPVVMSMEFASEEAARKCSRYGTRAGLPRLSELMDFIQGLERKYQPDCPG